MNKVSKRMKKSKTITIEEHKRILRKAIKEALWEGIKNVLPAFATKKFLKMFKHDYERYEKKLIEKYNLLLKEDEKEENK